MITALPVSFSILRKLSSLFLPNKLSNKLLLNTWTKKFANSKDRQNKPTTHCTHNFIDPTWSQSAVLCVIPYEPKLNIDNNLYRILLTNDFGGDTFIQWRWLPVFHIRLGLGYFWYLRLDWCSWVVSFTQFVIICSITEFRPNIHCWPWNSTEMGLRGCY